MNAAQRRKHARRVWGDHFRWPLGTRVVIQRGHHTPEVVGMAARVAKHGYPCVHRVNCIVDFPQPMHDRTFGAARFAQYVQFQHLKKASK